MQIIVKIKDVYGKPTIYPACEKSKIFANMLKQSTLTLIDIEHIKQLGYTIVAHTQEVTL